MPMPPRFRDARGVSLDGGDHVYVADAAQRQGAGRLLYEALIDTLRAQGFTQAIGAHRAAQRRRRSRCTRRSASAARACMREVGYKHGRWIDVGFWQCELADPPRRRRSRGVAISVVRG